MKKAMVALAAFAPALGITIRHEDTIEVKCLKNSSSEYDCKLNN